MPFDSNDSSSAANSSGLLKITQAELDYLQSYLGRGDRGGYYMALYNMTGNTQCLEQAQIATFSEGLGGTAYYANFMLQNQLTTNGEYPGVYFLSQQVALASLAAIATKLERNKVNGNINTGYIDRGEMFASANDAWKNNGVERLFPGNFLDSMSHLVPWLQQTLQLPALQPAENVTMQRVVEAIAALWQDNNLGSVQFTNRLLSDGTLAGVLGAIGGGPTLGKRLADYESRPEAYAIQTLPDSTYKVAISLQSGKVVGVFNNQLFPTDLSEFLNRLSSNWPAIVAGMVSLPAGFAVATVTSFLSDYFADFHRSLSEENTGFNGDINPRATNTFAGGAGYPITDPGTSGNDTRWGTGGAIGAFYADLLRGGAGNDRMFGGDGADELHGDSGDDVVYGQTGNDALYGEVGADVLRGGVGNDTLHGGDGNDALDGDDLNPANAGSDNLYGDAGNDTLAGGGGDDSLRGGSENDALYGGQGNDSIDGGDGSDYLEGNTGADTLVGGEGNDRLLGGEGADLYTFSGAFGSDTIEEDNAGQGVIQVTGLGNITGAGASKTSATSSTWQSADKRITYSVVPTDATHQDLVIVVRDGANAGTFTVRNWSNGRLGITLGDAVQAPHAVPAVSSIYVLLNNPQSPGSFSVTAPDSPSGRVPDVESETGNVIEYTNLTAEGRRVLAWADGGQVITLGDGADLVQVARPTIGPVYPSGVPIWGPVAGEDEDYVISGGGNDTIYTGYGSDYVSAGAGDDYIFAGAFYVGAAANGLGTQYHDPADASAVDVVDAGSGNDYAWGSMGADILMGGAGLDGLMGMEGADILMGGDDGDTLNGDGVYTLDTAVFERTVGSLLGYTTGGDDILFGGNGNDRLLGGVGRDTVSGDAGADQLFGDTDSYYVASGNMAWIPPEFHAADVLNGGAGDDYLLGGGGVDELYGGSDNDFLSGDQLNAGNASIALAYHGNDYLDGGDGADTLYGDGGRDTLLGGNGADLMYGESVDMLLADGADDYLDGGAGNDTLRGDGGSDTVYGGTESDVLYGDSGDPNLPSSGGGNDYLDGEDGNDTLIGQSGNDTLMGGAGTNWLYGQEGNDSLVGGSGTNWLSGGEGIDTLISMGTRDTLDGGAGRDVLRIAAGASAEVMYGAESEGDDIVLEGISSTDVRIGITTSDEFFWQTAVLSTGSVSSLILRAQSTQVPLGVAINSLTFADGVTWTQSQTRQQMRGTATTGSDVLYALTGENTTHDGLAGNDQISGSNGDDTFFGGDGADTLNGSAGNDSLTGGLGNDVLVGGAGYDTFFYALGDGNDNVSDFSDFRLEFGTGITPENIVVDHFRILLPDGGSVSFANADDAVLYLPNEVAFASGVVWNRQRLYQEALKGTSADQSIVGFGGDDSIYGLAGADSIYGMSGNDSLYGGDGADLLDGGLNGYGDAGFDLLDGGAGNDTLQGAGQDTFTGGTGDDLIIDRLVWGYSNNATYRYQLGDGNDTISDDSGEDDRLELGEGIAASTTSFGWTAAGMLRFNFAGQGSITLANVYNVGIERVMFSDGTVWDANMLRLRALTATAGNDILYTFGQRSEVLNGLAGDDILGGRTSLDTLFGGDGNDSIYGGGVHWSYSGSDYLDGGAGNDRLEGGLGNSVYAFGRGDGQDSIVSYGDYSSGRYNKVLFKAGVASDEVILSRSPSVANALLVSIVGTTDSILVLDFFSGSDQVNSVNPVQAIEFADGTVWNTTRMLQEVANSAPQNQTIDGTAGNDVLTGAAGNDTLNGLAGNDRLVGNAGSDSLNGGAGADTMLGGAGDDFYLVDDPLDVLVEEADAGTDTVYSTVSMTLLGQFEILRLTGTGNIAGTGNAATNLLAGNDGANRLDGGAGYDSIIGGAGDDTYVVDNIYDSTTEWSGGGLDTVESSVTWTLANEVENLTLTSNAAINGTGNTLNNVITGNGAGNVLTGAAGNDTLVGAAGTDTMLGGAGNDVYGVDSASDVVTELANEGTDTVQASVTWALGNNLENLTLTGTAAINATGNTLNNVLTGNGAANVLDGGSGADTMSGGAGDDIYVVDNTADVLTESAGAGTDTVQASITFTLGSNLENLTLTGSSTINGTGNTLDNLLTGNNANNTLTGGAGNDTLDGGSGNDTLVGGAGNDIYVVNVTTDVVTEVANEGTDTVRSAVTWTLGTNVENLVLTGVTAINGTGNTLANTVTGNSAANTLDGGTGADTLIGGAGNDTYTVDNTGDVITELANEGTDAMNSSVTCTLAANVENLTLTGTTAINGTGNTLDNLLTGNSANNTLTGGAGNDTLDGGTGNDTMLGGAGNDTYTVNVTTDVVTENANEGIDTVRSAVTWTLGNNVENLTLTGTGAINGTGNSLDNALTGNSANNTLTGNAGNDTLDGGSGNDTLRGGTGNDTYVVNVSTDSVTENANEGTDTVQSSVAWTLGSNLENLTLLGTTAINGTGNTLNNVLTGNAAANVLTGAAGDDTYDGAAGNDTFTDTSTTSHDTYRWGIGSGLDTLTDSGGSLDHVDLFAGITRSQLVFAQSGNHLQLSVSGQSDRLTINNWYASSANRIEEFRLSDGSRVLASEVQSLISAMATFSAASESSASTGSRMTAMPVLNTDLTAASLV